MIEVRAYDDGRKEGIIYDVSKGGRGPRKVGELRGELRAGASGEGGYWGDTQLSRRGFELAIAAIKEARKKLKRARIRRLRRRDRAANRTPRPGGQAPARDDRVHEGQELGYVPHMRVREEGESPLAIQGRLDAARRRRGTGEKLKTFVVKEHFGAKQSGTYRAKDSEAAKAAAARDWGVKTEELTAAEI